MHSGNFHYIHWTVRSKSKQYNTSNLNISFSNDKRAVQACVAVSRLLLHGILEYTYPHVHMCNMLIVFLVYSIHNIMSFACIKNKDIFPYIMHTMSVQVHHDLC